MLVLTTLQNICQLLINVWRQANPATRNRTRDHLISASSTVRCSTNLAFGYRSATWLTLSLALRFRSAERD